MRFIIVSAGCKIFPVTNLLVLYLPQHCGHGGKGLGHIDQPYSAPYNAARQAAWLLQQAKSQTHNVEQGFKHNVAAHFGRADAPVGEDNGEFANPQAGLVNTVGHLDLERIAV